MEYDTRWLAGFFDGEGSIGVYPINQNTTKTITYYVLKVSLAQSGNVGKLICGKLQSMFGGTAYRSIDKEGNKPQYKWNISANKAVEFLKFIEPHLIIKKRECELAIRFQSLESKREDFPEAGYIANEMKKIKENY